MSDNVSVLVTERSIVLMIDGKSHIVGKVHPNYDKIKEKVIAKDYTDILLLIDIPNTINEFGSGKVVVKDGQITYEGEVLHGAIVTRIFKMIEEGFDVNPMVLFLENLMLNPSKRAVDELYGFLEACSLPITDDGHFLAYKKVKRKDNGDLVDIYTGKFNNNVGQIPEVRRNQVDEDKERTCSYGLHFCSQSYLPHFGVGSGNAVVIVKINPRDVVAIPVDYNNAKGRTCRYEVVSEHELSDYEFPHSVDSRFSSSEDDYEDREFEDEDDYDAGYDAGKAKALRHNKRGWGSIERQEETDFDEGYWEGYHVYVNAGLPKKDPALKKPSTAVRDPKTGRYVSKAPIAPVAIQPTPVQPAIRKFTKNPTTGLLEATDSPKGPVRDPATGRFLPKA